MKIIALNSVRQTSEGKEEKFLTCKVGASDDKVQSILIPRTGNVHFSVFFFLLFYIS